MQVKRYAPHGNELSNITQEPAAKAALPVQLYDRLTPIPCTLRRGGHGGLSQQCQRAPRARSIGYSSAGAVVPACSGTRCRPRFSKRSHLRRASRGCRRHVRRRLSKSRRPCARLLRTHTLVDPLHYLSVLPHSLSRARAHTHTNSSARGLGPPLPTSGPGLGSFTAHARSVPQGAPVVKAGKSEYSTPPSPPQPASPCTPQRTPIAPA